MKRLPTYITIGTKVKPASPILLPRWNLLPGEKIGKNWHGNLGSLPEME
jgi:hypothetical protein